MEAGKGEGGHLAPTVIIQSQQNEEEGVPSDDQINPFFIELKEDFNPLGSQNYSFSSNCTPGFYFNTPSMNPFNFIQSPSTPKNI